MTTFVKFVEHNDWEGETWVFWLQFDHNSLALDQLQTLILEGSYGESYRLDTSTRLSEEQVDILCEHSGHGYMNYHNKVKGFLRNLPTLDDDNWDDDPFYKGRIAEFFGV